MADDNMMRIGKRCYVSNLAWRTSWQVSCTTGTEARDAVLICCQCVASALLTAQLSLPTEHDVLTLQCCLTHRCFEDLLLSIQHSHLRAGAGASTYLTTPCAQKISTRRPLRRQKNTLRQPDEPILAAMPCMFGAPAHSSTCGWSAVARGAQSGRPRHDSPCKIQSLQT